MQDNKTQQSIELKTTYTQHFHTGALKNLNKCWFVLFGSLIWVSNVKSAL